MTRRREKDRQRDRKTRNTSEEAKLFEPADEPVDWSRLRQRFTTMTSRRQPVLNGLVLSGVIVVARDPKELVAETERVLAKLKNECR